jgi:hypothetical protein
MPGEAVAQELAQRLSLLIGMIMEDEVDRAITISPGAHQQELSLGAAVLRMGQDIMALAAAAEGL